MILHRTDPARNRYRWYSVEASPTLLDGWAVVCGWGRIGGNYARWRSIPADSQEQAKAMAAKIIQKKIRRGYVPQYKRDDNGSS
jgi:predicted DNA-binding WGR domain protein